jgi:hypothetical protein
MRETLIALTAPFAVWLVAAPWVDGDPSTLGTLGGTAAGVLLLAGAVLALAVHCRRWSIILVEVLGALIVVFGIVAFPAGLAVRLAAVIVGLLAVALAVFAAVLPPPSRIRAVNKRGGTLAEIKSLKIRDGKIAAPSILLGSMPETVYITPGEIWNLLGAIGPDLIRAMPKMILAGRKESLAAPQDAVAHTGR